MRAALLGSALAAFFAFVALASPAGAQGVLNAQYSINGSTIAVSYSAPGSLQGCNFGPDVRLVVWALNKPWFQNYDRTGYLLASQDLGRVNCGYAIPAAPLSLALAAPPAGSYSMWIALETATPLCNSPGGFSTDQYCVVNGDAYTDAGTHAFGAVPLVPQVGLWWNPDESGSGYALDVKHNVLVVTIYSYSASGAPQWYLASGPLSADGRSFVGTLDKYQGGQCISCAYSGRPALVGNDGAIAITFATPTSATITLPGGRVTQIQPQAF
jgi:hypothetical protein